MTMRIGYVLKRYPRYSETFIVNEILAHEAAGLNIYIFALRPPEDTHFQDKISRVRAPVFYLRKPIQGHITPSLTSQNPTAASYLWAELQESAQLIPDIWEKLAFAAGERSSTVYQALWPAREIRRQQITHLHAHFGTVATSVARLAAHFTDIPYSFTAHAKDIFHESVDPEDLKRKLRDAQSVVTVSDYSVSYLKQKYGAAASRVTKLYNGMNMAELTYHSPEKREKKIISVGRLVEKKGLSYLINACDLLRQWGQKFTCQIVGKGELKESLQVQIEAMALGDYVELIGPRPQGEVFRKIQQAAVFAAPYVVGSDGNRDGLPTVLIEAMALGTPCVATDVTGIPEIIRHQETGLQVAQRDERELAKALQQYLTSSDLRVAMAKNARTLVEDCLDIEKNAAVLRSHFKAKTPKQTLSISKEQSVKSPSIAHIN